MAVVGLTDTIACCCAPLLCTCAAAQDLLEDGGVAGKDASGNPILKDIGTFLKSKFKQHFTVSVGSGCRREGLQSSKATACSGRSVQCHTMQPSWGVGDHTVWGIGVRLTVWQGRVASSFLA